MREPRMPRRKRITASAAISVLGKLFGVIVSATSMSANAVADERRNRAFCGYRPLDRRGLAHPKNAAVFVCSFPLSLPPPIFLFAPCYCLIFLFSQVQGFGVSGAQILVIV